MDTAALASSLNSGTTYLRSPAEELLGHPAAKVIDQNCVTATLQEGCRLLTHATTGAKSRDKPYRWMVLRRVPWDQVLAADPQHGDGSSAEETHPEAAWHAVIAELMHDDPHGSPIVCDSHFLSNFDLIFTVFREKFEPLDEDNPRIIEAAVQDQDFITVLRQYFSSGSPDNPKFMHTMATAAFLNGTCLLHHCCEKNFVRCVDHLLSGFTPVTAPAEEPWLQLADPLWQDRGWKNSAFSIAAYRGHTQLLSVLWTWAGTHNLQDRVIHMRDKRGKDLCELIEDRMRRLGPRGPSFVSTFNVVAQAFGRGRREQLAHFADENLHESAEEARAIIERGDERSVLNLPARQLTLQQLEQFLASASAHPPGAGLLILNLTVSPAANSTEESSHAARLLQLLRGYERVCFMKCSAGCTTSIHLVREATAIFSAGCAWRSLGIVPSWTTMPEQEQVGQLLNQFSQAIEAFLEAVRNACGRVDVHGFDMPQGSNNYYPPERKHLACVLAHAFTVKRVARNLVVPGVERTELRRKLSQDETAFNPLLSVFTVLERKLLNKVNLVACSSVVEAMDPAWEQYTTEAVAWLLAHLSSFPEWGPRMGLQPGSEDAELLFRLVDQALLILLKMRESSQRQGLVFPNSILTALDQTAVHLPRVQEYRLLRHF